MNLNNFKLESTQTYFAHLSNDKLRNEIEECQDDINDLRQEQLRLKHSKGTKIEKQYQSKIQMKLCLYFLNKAKNSKNSQVRKEGNKLLKILQKNY